MYFKIYRDYLKKFNLKLLKWELPFPDLNIIENQWDPKHALHIARTKEVMISAKGCY